MENCKLPRDLVIDILAKLSVKSLMRFKCVCKFFYDLIKSNHFIHKHYGISKAKTDCVLLEVGRGVREYYLLYKESEYDEIGCIYLDIPRVPRLYAQWAKCCQGMLCLISCKNNTIVPGGVDYLIYDVLIWNPSIRKVKALPSITVPCKLPYAAFVVNEFGFGISSYMTWKIVMLLEIYSQRDVQRNVRQIAMVYSQVRGDSWSLRQINSATCWDGIQGDDFYLKGKYYWRVTNLNIPYNHYLLWFDMDDEVFGTIELPSNVIIASVTIMNDTIALLGYPNLEDFSCIEIWLMIEDDNNTYWRKQVRTDCVVNVDNNECWKPLGIWNVDSELLVFLDTTSIHWDPVFAKRDVPYFISLDLVTQERKIFSISKERKYITMVSNSAAGYVQVCNEKNIDITEEWKRNIFMPLAIYARVYGKSLHFL